LSLTSVYFLDSLTHVKFLNISGNQLSRLGKSLNALTCLEALIADCNNISSIETGFQLPSLRTLSLQFNRLPIDSLSKLTDCKNLSKVIIHGNPAAINLDELSIIQVGQLFVTDAEDLTDLSSSFVNNKVRYV